MSHRAVFIDRDDTIIHDPGYLSDPAQVRLMPGVGPAIRALAGAGYKVVLVTNQSAIARGMISEDALARIHEELIRQLAAQGARLDAIYYCPFHPEGTVPEYTRESDLRKPQPGMLLQAAKDLDLDLAASWMIGDSLRDVEAGARAGCRTILLGENQGLENRAEPRFQTAKAGSVPAFLPDFTAADMSEAVATVLGPRL